MLSIFEPAAKSPCVQQDSIGVPRALPFRMALSLACTDSRSRNLTVNMAGTTSTRWRRGTSCWGARRWPRSFLAFGSLTWLFGDYVRARYDWMAARVQKRFSARLHFLWTKTSPG